MATALGAGHSDVDQIQLNSSEFRAGQTIFEQGDPGDRAYFIVTGKVKISFRSPAGRTGVRAIMGPTDIFGELALFDPGPRAGTATAITDLRVMCLDRAALRAWMAYRPSIAEQLLRALSQRLQDTEEQIVELVSNDVAARVARQLLLLAGRFGTREGEALRVAHELSQDEIAQLVGADRASVNKTLRDFTTRGWILLGGKSVLIIDSEALARRSRAGNRTGPDSNRRRRPLRATA